MIGVAHYFLSPASRVNFAVYEPKNTTLLYGNIVIEGYKKDALNIYITQPAKIGYEIYGDGRQVVEGKAHDFTYSCKNFIGTCDIRQTENGQKYIYSHAPNQETTNFTREWAAFEKGGTEIRIYRNTYSNKHMDTAAWSDFIESFQKVPKSSVARFYRVGSKFNWLGP